MKNKSRERYLSIIALGVSLTPVFWFLREIPLIGIVLFALFILSGFGIFTQLAGLVLGCFALAEGITMKDTKHTIISTAAIVCSIGWLVFLSLGGTEYIMSYK